VARNNPIISFTQASFNIFAASLTVVHVEITSSIKIMVFQDIISL
jgi:hypothetical protein